MAIYWTKPTESGLGDRLKDIVLLAAYGKIFGEDVYMTWQRYAGHVKKETRALDPSHRYIDTILDNVKKHINFPKNIIIENEIMGVSGWANGLDTYRLRSKFTLFEFGIGGVSGSHGFWHAYLKDKCTFEEYEIKLEEALSEFGFCKEITDFLNTLPELFISFHIRRGDKVRAESTDGTYIHSDDLSELNKITYEAIDYYADRYDTFFICSDQDDKKQEFSDYLKSKNKKILELPLMEKWQQTYYDIATMTKSKVNIASNRYSSFSSFAAQMGKGNFKTVYDFKEKDENQ